MLTYGAPILSASLLVLALVAPPSWPAWQMFGLVTATLWLAWVIWGWPAVRVDAESVNVRNAMRTWRIPLRTITGVEGGRRLTLSLSDGSVVTAAAVSGEGTAVDAWRRADAYTEGGHFVRNASDVSLGPGSAATEWAKRVRDRVRDAPATDAGPVSLVNVGIILGSIAAVALFVVTVTVLP
ncbi:hypothetical protein GCM10009796_00540 [Microbacterium koreense]